MKYINEKCKITVILYKIHMSRLWFALLDKYPDKKHNKNQTITNRINAITSNTINIIFFFI